MIRKICKKATVWLLAGVISLSAVTVQAAEVDNGASYPITTNAIEGWPQGPDTYSETAVLMDADTEQSFIIREWMKRDIRRVSQRS
ncbi:MAG: hypothetical protein ACLT1I_12635 [Mediterraneibacter faecis]